MDFVMIFLQFIVLLPYPLIMCFLSIHFVWTVWEKKSYQTRGVEYTQADDPIMFYVAIGIGMFSLVFHFGLLLVFVKFLIEKLPF